MMDGAKECGRAANTLLCWSCGRPAGPPHAGQLPGQLPETDFLATKALRVVIW